ncbi:hypothetical protein [Pedobacter sp. UC225_65]|uniref:hypothetical protein n=1 Tax=Pedobacter sp. UC225_65 TaxID=3350173 RepID=UPI00367196F2
MSIEKGANAAKEPKSKDQKRTLWILPLMGFLKSDKDEDSEILWRLRFVKIE